MLEAWVAEKKQSTTLKAQNMWSSMAGKKLANTKQAEMQHKMTEWIMLLTQYKRTKDVHYMNYSEIKA